VEGDKHKPKKTFIRWLESTDDGRKDPKGKTARRVPSLTDKQYERRWRRRQNKKIIEEE